MAQHELGKITTLVNVGAWSEFDVIISYFDDSTKSVIIKRNDIEESSGETLTVVLAYNQGRSYPTFDTEWIRSYTYYEALISNLEYTFEPITYYPYFSTKTKELPYESEEEGESNEINIAFVSVTKATSSTAKDGEIVVSASGANGTAKFALEKPDYTNGQTSGTFSNLPAGRYTIYAQDNKAYFAYITVRIGFEGSQHTPKWRADFTDRDGSAGRIDICERGNVGSPLSVNASAIPFTYSTRGENQNFEDMSILSGQADISLVSSEADQYLAISQADDDQFIAKIYLDQGSGLSLIFQGFINPTSFTDTPSSSNYLVSFTANDRLAYLSNFDFVRADIFESGTTQNEFIRGDNSQMSAIIACLDKTNLSQGFRIACNIFETNQTQTNTTPFHETFFNADVYIKDDMPEKCNVVLKHILEAYSAILISWDGYWYIIRQKEFLEDTINYKQFDTDGVYQSAGSYNPRVEFKRPDQNNRFRWLNGYSRSFTETYRYVNLIIDTVVRDGGFIDPFTKDYAIGLEWQPVVTFKGFTVKKNNTNFAHSLVNKGSILDRNDYWRLQLREAENASSYFLWNKNIDHNGNDRCIVRIKYNVQALYNPHAFNAGENHQNPIYAILKWRLKLGNRYLTSDKQWTTTVTENEHFVTNFDKDDEFELLFDMPSGGQTSNESIQLRVYPVSFFEHHTYGVNSAAMITALEAVSTTSLGDQTRRVCKFSVGAMRYYELQVTSKTADDYYVVEPNDYHASTNNRRWVLVSEIFYYQASSLFSTTDFKYVQLDYLPAGNEPVEEIKESFLNLPENRLDKEVVIHQFDLDNKFNNDEKLFINYTKLSNGNPTEDWQETAGGTSKRLVYHKIDWIQQLTKKARMRVSGAILTDMHVTPIHVFYDPDDLNRIFYPIGVSYDYKRKQHSGELMEISSDDLPTNSGFDIQAFDQDQFQ